MRRTFGLLPFLAVAAFAQEANPGRGVNFYSIEKEVALGRQVAAEFQRNQKPLVSPEAQTYIEELGRRLATQSGNTAFTFTFSLIADDPAALHEPASFPGGFVFVPASLILAAHDEDELIGMMAHAIAHIAARHGAKQASRAEIASFTIPLIYTGGRAGLAIEQGNRMAIPMNMLAMSRRYELEADSLAVRMMSAAGYDPAALVRYLEREQPPDDATGTKWSALPARAERLSAIRTAVESIPARAYERRPGFDSIRAEVLRLTAR